MVFGKAKLVRMSFITMSVVTRSVVTLSSITGQLRSLLWTSFLDLLHWGVGVVSFLRWQVVLGQFALLEFTQRMVQLWQHFFWLICGKQKQLVKCEPG